MRISGMLIISGIGLAGTSRSLRNRLRVRAPFPTRITNVIEIGGPTIGLLLVLVGVVLFALGS